MSLPTAPRTGQQAIDAAVARVGGTMPDGSGFCLKFVRQNYEVPGVYASAIDAWNATHEPHPGDYNPPPSAAVWFWSSSPYRHVAFHLGAGQYATTFNADIRQLDIDAMEATFGTLIGWAPDLNEHSLRPGTIPPPLPPTHPFEGDEMIRIFAPGRGFAVIGAGYYKPLTEEEYQNSEPLVTKTLEGSDRQFDLWRAIAHHGVASFPGAS